MTWLTLRYPWPGDEISGIFHRTQAKALTRLGLQVIVTSPTPWAPPPLSLISEHWRQYAEAPRRQVDDGVEIRRPRYLAVPRQPKWARPEDLVASAALRDSDIWMTSELIHAHFAWPNAIAARTIAREFNLPYVVTLHGYDLNTFPDQHPERIPILRRSLRHAACVIGVSDALVERAKEFAGVDAVSLPLGVETARFMSMRLPKDEARRRLGLPADRFIALFVARLFPHKGISQFVDALLDAAEAQLPRGTLGVVVGDGPLMGYRAEEGKARDRVRYEGPQPPEMVAAYMSAADVQILPSFSEGLPTVLVEAGAVGVPVIGSTAGGIPQLLGTDRGIVMSEVTPDQIRAALRASVDPGASAERARRLNEHVLDRFDVDRNARQLLDIYRDVAASAHPARTYVGVSTAPSVSAPAGGAAAGGPAGDVAATAPGVAAPGVPASAVEPAVAPFTVLLVGDVDSVHVQRWTAGLRAHGVNVVSIDLAGRGRSAPRKIAAFVGIRRRLGRLHRYPRTVVAVHYLHGGLLSTGLRGLHPMVLSAWGRDVTGIRRGVRGSLSGWQLGHLVRSADAVTATSRFLADVVRRRFGVESTIIPFGIDVEQFTPAAPDERAPRDPSAPLRIGFVKWLEPKYAPDVLVEALALLAADTDFEATLVGNGGLEARLRERVDELGLGDRVRLLGRRPHDEVPSLLRSFDVFVMPSREEEWGVAAAEASACELPVVATRVGGIPEIVVDGVTGLLVPPEDPHALADAIRTLARDAELRRSMGRAGRDRIVELFPWDRCIEAMIEVQRRALERCESKRGPHRGF